MKKKEIERALEIVYFNPDKFKLVKSGVDEMRYIYDETNTIIAAYRFPDYYNPVGTFKILLYYDNRT